MTFLDLIRPLNKSQGLGYLAYLDDILIYSQTGIGTFGNAEQCL